MWMNGSRCRRSTPANARRTGKPSPSKPDGAVVTERTWRSRASTVGAGSFGRVKGSALTAGMSGLQIVAITTINADRARVFPVTGPTYHPPVTLNQLKVFVLVVRLG